MWSLPNISKLNANAVENYKKVKRSKPLRGKKCEFCEASPAAYREEVYDIFGDKDVPKSYILICNDCSDHGKLHEDESIFWCNGCNRYHVTNYTWENYYTFVNEEKVCLRCAFEAHLKEPGSWTTDAPTEITLNDLKKIPHVIAVESTYWEDSLIFIGNAEFDSTDGHQISGDSLTEIVGRALAQAAARDIITSTLEDAPRCIILLDAGYQFAVSFGVYIERKFSGAKAVAR
jgi:hypothetical protein